MDTLPKRKTTTTWQTESFGASTTTRTTDSAKPEDRKYDLTAKMHTEGHSHILDIVDVEPTRDANGLVQAHIGLNPNLNNLVDQQDNSHHNDY